MIGLSLTGCYGHASVLIDVLGLPRLGTRRHGARRCGHLLRRPWWLHRHLLLSLLLHLLHLLLPLHLHLLHLHLLLRL